MTAEFRPNNETAIRTCYANLPQFLSVRRINLPMFSGVSVEHTSSMHAHFALVANSQVSRRAPTVLHLEWATRHDERLWCAVKRPGGEPTVQVWGAVSIDCSPCPGSHWLYVAVKKVWVFLRDHLRLTYMASYGRINLPLRDSLLPSSTMRAAPTTEVSSTTAPWTRTFWTLSLPTAHYNFAGGLY